MLPRTVEFHLGANISKNRIANVSFEFDFQNATKPNCMLGIQYPNLQDFHATSTSWIQSRVEFKRVWNNTGEFFVMNSRLVGNLTLCPT